MNNIKILKEVILKEVLLTDYSFFSTSFNPERTAEKFYNKNDENQTPVVCSKAIQIVSIGTPKFDDIDALTEFSEVLESFSTEDFISMYLENCEEKGLNRDFVEKNYVDVWENILNEIDAKIEKIKNERDEFYSEILN